jgi:hypothetical protein
MTYAGRFGGVSRAAGLAPTANQIAIIPLNQDSSQTAPSDNEVLLFDSTYRNPVGTLLLPSFSNGGQAFAAHGKWVFFNQAANTIFVVAQADSSAGLALDFAIDTFPDAASSGCTAQFSDHTLAVAAAGATLTETVLDPNGCVYSASSGVNWIKVSPNSFGNASP